jgi:hypothetical protein
MRKEIQFFSSWRIKNKSVHDETFDWHCISRPSTIDRHDNRFSFCFHQEREDPKQTFTILSIFFLSQGQGGEGVYSRVLIISVTNMYIQNNERRKKKNNNVKKGVRKRNASLCQNHWYMPIIDCHGQGKKRIGFKKEAFKSIQSCHRQGIEESHTLMNRKKDRGHTHTHEADCD